MSSKVDSQSKDNLLPLHQAIMKNDRSEISRLLAENTDIEAWNYQGRTALHLAALLVLEDLVQVLLKADANIEVKDHEDMTPLHYASWYLHQGIVKLLESKEWSNIKHWAGKYIWKCRLLFGVAGCCRSVQFVN